MIYIALLRGINVGGNKKVSMLQLKEIFEEAGCEQVRTYINSGNVIFHDSRSMSDIQKVLDEKLRTEVLFDIKLLIIDMHRFKTIHNAIPDDWQNDAEQKCDVMFLWNEFNNKDVQDHLSIKPGIDSIKYVDGAFIWRVARKNVTRSGMLKLVGTDLYKHMTIRNCNTVRKLQKIIDSDTYTAQ